MCCTFTLLGLTFFRHPVNICGSRVSAANIPVVRITLSEFLRDAEFRRIVFTIRYV